MILNFRQATVAGLLATSALAAQAAPVEFIGYTNVCGGSDPDAVIFRDSLGVERTGKIFGEFGIPLNDAMTQISGNLCGFDDWTLSQEIVGDAFGVPVETYLSQLYSVLPGDSEDYVPGFRAIDQAWDVGTTGYLFNPMSFAWGLDPNGLGAVVAFRGDDDVREVEEPNSLALAGLGLAMIAVGGLGGVVRKANKKIEDTLNFGVNQ
jgi:hypothetical protein